ncbi:MAG TPA: alpha/beta fold hydrolase [Verrucomicrobiales bacterium]|nr:alpha/beta fold hydrolase [Verrucomicrobiales bacterium]
MLSLRFILSLLLSGLALNGCAPYAKVVEIRPEYAAMAAGTGESAIAAQYLQAALDPRQPLTPEERMGRCLAAADVFAAHLHRHPRAETALKDYNFALGVFFSVVRKNGLEPWRGPLRVPSPRGIYFVTLRSDPKALWKAADCEFLPADELMISGSYVSSRTRRPGIGAPLVARRREPLKTAAEDFVLSRTEYGVTAVAEFSGRKCVIDFEDPLSCETITVSGTKFPLAADFTAPIAIRLAGTNYRKLELLNLVRPNNEPDSAGISAGIVRLQPFDPEKTTVLVVHGLFDSPATWAPMINTLRGDPEIRKHYQFWFFGYPSGYPYPYSAALLRKQLDAALRKFPQRKPMILIGHSMGGLLSRLMITDSGDKLWMKMFGKPPESTRLRGRSGQILRESLLFKSRPEVGRVIFIATPHRGSKLASGIVGRLAMKLIKAPKFLLDTAMDATRLVTMDTGGMTVRNIPNSISTLSPNDTFVKAINTIPIRAGVPYHSIIGDRGKGDTPNSSDGAVPYWSSHLEGAQSELIVPSGHRAHQHPAAIAEVRRILLLNQKRR